MATLTLKKAPQILRQPLPSVIGKYALMRQHTKSVSMRFTRYHESIESAKKEAVRLQAEFPHTRYLVIQILDYVGV